MKHASNSHYLLTVVLCAVTLTIIVMHSKLHHMQVSLHELTRNYSDACQHILLPDSVIKWYGLCRHPICPHLFRTACSHPGSSHPYENHAVIAVIVSGGVSYLERCEGDFCVICVSQLTIVLSVTVVMLCGWGKGVGLKACQY